MVVEKKNGFCGLEPACKDDKKNAGKSRRKSKDSCFRHGRIKFEIKITEK
jgi:hypothetical protein